MPEKKKPSTHRPRPTKTEAELYAEYLSSKPRMFQIDSNGLTASIDLLNSATLFEGRIKFVWIRRRGSMIQAEFNNGRTAEWSATDLRTFARSQDILFEVTGFLIRTPGRLTKKLWEIVAQMIRDIADQNAIDLEPSLKDEFQQVLRSAYIRLGCPTGMGKEAFFKILRRCQNEGSIIDTSYAQTNQIRRYCVWVGGAGECSEQYAWTYQEALMEWLGMSRTKSKYYAWEEVRKALGLLDFEQRQLHQSWNGEKINVRVWRGPIDVLAEDNTIADTQL